MKRPFRDPVPLPSVLQPYYDLLAAAAGCSGALHNQTSFACLRAVPSDALFNATQVVYSQSGVPFPFNRVIDGYFHEVAPSTAVRNRLVSTIPIITGKILRHMDEFG